MAMASRGSGDAPGTIAEETETESGSIRDADVDACFLRPTTPLLPQPNPPILPPHYDSYHHHPPNYPEGAPNMDTSKMDPRPLVLTVAEAEDEKIASLRLIADSIAQQRQTAAKALILHPLWLATVALCLAVSYRVLWTNKDDWSAIAMTWTSCIMTGLVAVRYLTTSYIEHAEKTGTWRWLYEGSGHAAGARNAHIVDHVLITKLGAEVIGVLVLRPVRTSAGIEPHIRGARHFVRGQDMYFPVGVIRAWTVQRRYRGHGVGRELLERAASICQEQGWGEPIFSHKHANAVQGVARWAFDKGDDKARNLLAKIVRGKRSTKRESDGYDMI